MNFDEWFNREWSVRQPYDPRDLSAYAMEKIEQAAREAWDYATVSARVDPHEYVGPTHTCAGADCPAPEHLRDQVGRTA